MKKIKLKQQIKILRLKFVCRKKYYTIEELKSKIIKIAPNAKRLFYVDDPSVWAVWQNPYDNKALKIGETLCRDIYFSSKEERDKAFYTLGTKGYESLEDILAVLRKSGLKYELYRIRPNIIRKKSKLQIGIYAGNLKSSIVWEIPLY